MKTKHLWQITLTVYGGPQPKLFSPIPSEPLVWKWKYFAWWIYPIRPTIQVKMSPIWDDQYDRLVNPYSNCLLSLNLLSNFFIIFANTGSNGKPILTPSFCSLNLVKIDNVLVHSWSKSYFKDSLSYFGWVYLQQSTILYKGILIKSNFISNTHFYPKKMFR